VGSLAGALFLSAALQLSATTVTIGQTLTGSAALTNCGAASVSLLDVAIGAVPPGLAVGQGNAGDDIFHAGPQTIAPGGRFALQGGRPFTASDATGSWQAWVAYEDSSGNWWGFEPPTVPFTVAAADGGSSLAPPPGYTAAQLAFDDTFPGPSLDSTKWNPYVASNASQGYPWNANGSGGSAASAPGSFDAEYFEPSALAEDLGLFFSATLGSSQPGYQWTSGAICSYGKAEFTGGYVQISMRQPDGNGMWPGLWMLPGQGAGSSGDDFEIDIQEGGYTGTGSPSGMSAWHEHASGVTCGGVTQTGVDLGSGLHVYGVDWQPGSSLSYYVDGTQVGQITSAQCAISDEPMELILDLQVADSSASGWHTVADSTTPSPSVMQVGEVQVYQ